MVAQPSQALINHLAGRISKQHDGVYRNLENSVFEIQAYEAAQRESIPESSSP
jgi:hypothetical protein